MRATILQGWTLMRFLRLAMGVAATWQGVQTHDTILSIAGIFLLVMAVANVGCCGSGGCAVTPPRKKNDVTLNKEVVYEEVVNK